MQNADVFKRANKTSAKNATILKILRDHEQLMEWCEGEAVMDAGCGPGDVTAHVLAPFLPPSTRLVLGVDISHAMIFHAKTHHSTGKVTFCTADIGNDISHITHKDFDKIFSFYVLHWLQNLEKGMKNLLSLLRPGGQALLTFPVDRSFQRTFRKVSNEPQWREFFKFVSKKIPPFPTGNDPNTEFQEIISSVGFEVIKCEIIDDYSIFASADEMKDLIESLEPDIACVPSNLKVQYLNDCLQELESMKSVNVYEKKVILKQSMILCVLRKPSL